MKLTKNFMNHNLVKYYFFIIIQIIIQFVVNTDIEETCLYKIYIKSDNSKECVGHCPDGSCEVNDYCYQNIDDQLIEEIEDMPYKICRCLYKKKKKIFGNREVYQCLKDEEVCDTQYYSLDTRECVSKCGENEKILERKGATDDKTQYRCSSRCKPT